jgi:hypothetical protein
MILLLMILPVLGFIAWGMWESWLEHERHMEWLRNQREGRWSKHDLMFESETKTETTEEKEAGRE